MPLEIDLEYLDVGLCPAIGSIAGQGSSTGLTSGADSGRSAEDSDTAGPESDPRPLRAPPQPPVSGATK